MHSVVAIFWVMLLVFTGVVCAGEVININRASAAILDRELEGVGPAKAKEIVKERRRHGPFKSADDLTRVKGIGPKLVEKNRGKIVVVDSDDSVSLGTAE